LKIFLTNSHSTKKSKDEYISSARTKRMLKYSTQIKAWSLL